MSAPLEPVFLVAESRLLFSTDHARPISQRIRDAVEREQPTAAYIGASNGDDPAFYGIIEAAMDLVGVGDRRMVRADFARDDVRFLESADIILLFGGDPALGWRAMERADVVQLIRDRYCAGPVLIGVSAGAVLLGEKGSPADDDGQFELFDAFRLTPTIIDAHDEARVGSAQASRRRLRPLGHRPTLRKRPGVSRRHDARTGSAAGGAIPRRARRGPGPPDAGGGRGLSATLGVTILSHVEE
jgi:peptidase E